MSRSWRPKRRRDDREVPGNQRQSANLFSVLNDLLCAYSVFTPRPKESFDLFQVVFLHSHSDERHHSPRESKCNLKTMFNEVSEILRVPSPPESLLDDENNLRLVQSVFLHEFKKVKGPDNYQQSEEPHSQHDEELHSQHDEEPRSQHDGEPRSTFVSVAESSLVRAGVSIAIPPVDAGVGVERGSSISRTLRVLQTSYKMYTGGQLKKLIWTHINVIFPMIYAETEDEFPPEDDGKALVAIVTKKIITDIDVSSSSMKSRKVGLFSRAPAAPVSAGGEISGTFESCNSYSGVTGLHVILLPVERRSEYEYRVFKPIDVCNSEREDDSEPSGHISRFTDAKKWHQGVQPLVRDKMDVSTSNSDGTSSGTSGGEASSHSRGIVTEEEIETETPDEWVDVHIHAHERSLPWVDIDLEPIVDEIANHQCAIAESYFEQKRLQICIRLLRLVIRKCRFDSMVRALRCMASCYEETFGAPEEKLQQQRQGRRLRRCAEEISHGHDPEWFQEKENMLRIRQAPLPELEVLEVVTQQHSALSSVPSKPHSDGVFVADESNRMEYDRDRQESQKLALLPKTAPGMQPSKITDPPPPPPFGPIPDSVKQKRIKNKNDGLPSMGRSYRSAGKVVPIKEAREFKSKEL